MSTMQIAPRKPLKFTVEKIEVTGTPPSARHYHSSVVIDDDIYIIGGRETNGSTYESASALPLYTFWVFNTTRNEWRTINTTPPTHKHSDFQLPAVAIGNKIWINSTSVLCFDTETNTWTSHKHPEEASKSWKGHIAFTKNATVRGSKIYSYESEHLHVFDTETQTVSKPEMLGDLPYDRFENRLFNVGNKMLMFHDRPSYEKSFSFLIYLDPESAKWREPPQDKDDFTSSYSSFMTRVGNYLVGVERTKVFVIDLLTNKWTKHEIGSCSPTRSWSSGEMVGNSIYLFGGDVVGTITKVNVSDMPSSEENAEFETELVKLIDSMIAEIKMPGPPVDEGFAADPIVFDGSLSGTQWKTPEVYTKELMDLFTGSGFVDESSIIEHNLPSDNYILDQQNPETGKTYTLKHKNFIEYLYVAWANHFSVHISPDIMYYTILCEIAETIKKSPEAFRHIFTTSNNKQTIITLTGDVTKLDLPQLVAAIGKVSPAAQKLALKFSCTTPDAHLAHSAAICDAVSPYFTYMSTLCGIPRIRVLGTKEDWVLLETAVSQWATDIFATQRSAESDASNNTKGLTAYLKLCAEWLRKIHTTTNSAFWSEMFGIDHCRSGHTAMVTGWITQFYLNGHKRDYRGKISYSGNDFHNYNSHLSSVKYSNMETGRKFELYTGLCYSTFTPRWENPDAEEPRTEEEYKASQKRRKLEIEVSDDDLYPFLVPHFAHVIREVNAAPITFENYDKYLAQLTGSDRLALETYRDLMDEPVILEEGRKDEQILELFVKRVDSWIASAAKGVPLINCIDMTDQLIPIQYRYGTKTATMAKIDAALGELLASPYGPTSIKSWSDGAKFLENCACVTKISGMEFTKTDSMLALAKYLERPECPLRILSGSMPSKYVREYVSGHKQFGEDLEGENKCKEIYNDALTKLTSALAKSSLHTIDFNDAGTATVKSVCELLKRQDTPLRTLTTRSLRKFDARLLVDTLYTYNPPLEKLIVGDLLRWHGKERHQYYDETPEELASLGPNPASDKEMVSRFASYLLAVKTLHTLNIIDTHEEVISAIGKNPHIKHLALTFGWDEKKDTTALMRVFVAGSPQCVSLQTRPQTDEFTRWLRGNKTLKTLQTTGKLTPAEGLTVAHALRGNTTLESLSIRGGKDKQEKEFCKELSLAIRGGLPLRTLSLTDLEINDLWDCIKHNTTLVSISGGVGDVVTDEVASVIADIVTSHKNLKSINIRGQSQMTEVGWQKVLTAVKENEYIVQLSLPYPYGSPDLKSHYDAIATILDKREILQTEPSPWAL